MRIDVRDRYEKYHRNLINFCFENTSQFAKRQSDSVSPVTYRVAPICRFGVALTDRDNTDKNESHLAVGSAFRYKMCSPQNQSEIS